MMLLIDIGNSRSKWALTDRHSGVDWLSSGWWPNEAFESEHWRSKLEGIKNRVSEDEQRKVDWIAISCVSSEEVREQIAQYCKAVFDVTPILVESEATYQTRQGRKLRNSYEHHQALGVDRWLAMIACAEIESGAFAVIDAGTAITLDVVDEQGMHLCGHIIPGHKMMGTSLLRDTGRIGWSAQYNQHQISKVDWLATNTQQAVEYGTLTACVSYLEEALSNLMDHLQLVSVLMTGGDAELLSGLLNENKKQTIKLQKELVLQGLFYWSMQFLSKKTADEAN